jgi:hypothetical protein
LKKIDFLAKLGGNEEEIAQEIEKHEDLYRVQLRVIEDLIQNKDEKDAIDKILKYRNACNKDWQRYYRFSNQLIILYEQTGDSEMYKKELLDVVINYDQSCTENYKKLKCVCDAKEWTGIRENIINQQEDGREREAILYFEGLTDRLMDEILQNHKDDMMLSVYLESSMPKYEKALMKEHAAEMLGLYRRAVLEMSKTAAGRKIYRDMAGIMRKMKKCPGGEKEVKDLVGKWRIQYPKRKAMLEELGGL